MTGDERAGAGFRYDLVMPIDYANGKICYLEIPAGDVGRSSEFYRDVFGWRVRTRGDGPIAFDDGVGQVSGTWVTGRAPLSRGSLTVYIMVGDAKHTIDLIQQNGGKVVEPIHPESREVVALFEDPGGNVLGIYEHKS
jgi:predicted enzyme related to lactoylglutathione lyase